MDAEGHLQTAQLLPLAGQDALDPVVPVGEPEGQIHVGQVELGLGQRVGALRRHKQREFWEMEHIHHFGHLTAGMENS